LVDLETLTFPETASTKYSKKTVIEEKHFMAVGTNFGILVEGVVLVANTIGCSIAPRLIGEIPFLNHIKICLQKLSEFLIRDC
jgi:hypothetical protein